jgi:hypothetical protein
MTTICDQFREIRYLREGPLDGVRLRMSIPLSNGDRTVSRDSGERESDATGRREIRQGCESQDVWLERLDLGVLFRFIHVSLRQRRQRRQVQDM